MTAEQWQRVAELFEVAVEREPSGRAAFLAEACSGDRELLREVQSLLSEHERAGSFIQTPLLGGSVSPLNHALQELQGGSMLDGRLIGQALGHYQVLEQLGRGGMGVVYKARDTRLDRIDALKILPPELASDWGRMRRFVREAKAASALNHPNVATIYEIGECNGIRFIAMEYVAGGTLDAKIRRHPLETAEMVETAIQIADALDEAHRKGITHRDIKPGNIMLTPRGQVKVLDFGLAKVTRSEGQAAAGDSSTETAPGAVVGTVQYMSPEQVLGHKVDCRTDIFSLGVVLYEMATGRLPFSGASASETMDRILHAQPEAIARFNYSVPAELERITRKCLEKRPDRRYQSVRELLIDLRNLQGNGNWGEGALVEKSSAETARPVAGAVWLRWPVTLVAAGFILAAALAFWLGTPLPSPKVSGYTQISADGRRKLNTLVTDGSRLYFSELVDTQWVLGQVSSLGGETAAIPTPFPNVEVLNISPNRSELLVSTSTTTTWENPLWVFPIVGGSPRRMGHILAHDAAWSPDGQWIVYTKGAELYLVKSEGTAESHSLVKVAGLAHWPRWSPSGNSLRFSVTDTKTTSTSLWEVAADGSNLHPLLAGWNQPPRECCGSWTPDGKYFVFQSSRGQETNIWAIREKPGLLHKPRHEPVRLTYGPMNFVGPTPSLDGNKLFAVSEHRRAELVRYDSKKQEFVNYFSGISAGLEFSKDGEWVAYVTYPEQNLWRCKSDGSQRLQLSFRGLKASGGRWSPDGKRIAFAACTPGGPCKIYMVSAEGGSPEQLLPEDQDQEFDPSWSPDGNTLAFGQGTRTSPTRAIHLLDLGTNQLSKLPDSEGLFCPRWSPDGRYIAALPSDQHELLLFDLKTQKWQELAKGEIAYPHWSRDGEYIYFVRFLPNDPTLLRVRIHNRKLEQLAGLKDFRLILTAGMGLSPDNSPLFMRDISTREIYALDLQAP